MHLLYADKAEADRVSSLIPLATAGDDGGVDMVYRNFNQPCTASFSFRLCILLQVAKLLAIAAIKNSLILT